MNPAQEASEQAGSRIDPENEHGRAVIVNADDWGQDRATTDCSLECLRSRRISSVSAMVFMEDSGRASELARGHSIDAGLHLNFTSPFTDSRHASQLIEHQGRTARFLLAHRFNRSLYHPGLSASFDYLVKAQIDEFERIYSIPPTRLDGHHHMHLCANVICSSLLPVGTIVRRNFFFAPGEKSRMNRIYRAWQDRILARRHRIADFFFQLLPLEPTERLDKILGLAAHSEVEIETHPAREREFRFLTGDDFARRLGQTEVARGYSLRFARANSASVTH